MANLNQNWIIICIIISLDDTWKKVTFLLSLEWGFALMIGRRFHFLTHKAVALNDIRGTGLAGLLNLLPLLLLNTVGTFNALSGTNFIIVSCLWKILSVTKLFCYHQPGKLGRHTLHNGFLSLRKETTLLQGACVHAHTHRDIHTDTHLVDTQTALSEWLLSSLYQTANF